MSGNPLRAIARKWAHERHAFEVSESERAKIATGVATLAAVVIGGVLFFRLGSKKLSFVDYIKHAAANNKELSEKLAETEARANVLSEKAAQGQKDKMELDKLKAEQITLGERLQTTASELETLSAVVAQKTAELSATNIALEAARLATQTAQGSAGASEEASESILAQWRELQQGLDAVTAKAARADQATAEAARQVTLRAAADERNTELESELREATAKTADLRVNLAQAQDEGRKSAERASQAEAELEVVRAQLQDQRANVIRIAELVDDVESLQAALEAAKSQVRSSAERAAELEKANSQLTHLTTRNDALNDEMATVRAQNAATEEINAKLETELTALRASATQLDELKKLVAALQERENLSRAALGGAEVRAEDAERKAAELEKIKPLYEKALLDIAAMRARLEQSKVDAFNESAQRLEGLKNALDETRKELEAALKAQSTAEVDNEGLKKRVGSLQGEIEKLKEAEKTLDARLTGAETKATAIAEAGAKKQIAALNAAKDVVVQKLDAQIEDLKADVVAKSAEIANIREAAQKQASDSAALLLEKEKALAKVTQSEANLTQDVARLTKVESDATTEKSNLRGELQEAKQKLAEAEQRVSAAQGQAALAMAQVNQDQQAAAAEVTRIQQLAAAAVNQGNTEAALEVTRVVAAVNMANQAALTDSEQRRQNAEHETHRVAMQANATIAHQSQQNEGALENARMVVSNVLKDITKYLVDAQSGGANDGAALSTILDKLLQNGLLETEERDKIRDALRDVVEKAVQSTVSLVQALAPENADVVASRPGGGVGPARRKKNTGGKRPSKSSFAQIIKLGSTDEIEDVMRVLRKEPADGKSVLEVLDTLEETNRLEIMRRLLEKRLEDVYDELKKTVAIACSCDEEDAPEFEGTKAGVDALRMWAQSQIQKMRLRQKGALKERRPDDGEESAADGEESAGGPKKGRRVEGSGSADFGSGQVSAATLDSIERAKAELEAEHAKAQHMVIAFIMLTARVRWLERAHQLADAPKFGSAPRRRSYV
jgi:chromosome segregation ATPase